MNIGAHVRQGDLLFVRVAGVTPGARRLKHRVIAEGEATGHRHQVLEETAVLYEKEAELFLRAVKDSLVVHEEHRTVPLPSGIYRVVRQREYEPGTRRRIRFLKD